MSTPNLGEKLTEYLKGEQAKNGAVLLDDVRAFIRRFCVFPDDYCLAAVSLWAAHAHMVKEFHTTPRLAIVSPEASSGKTRVLEVLDLLVPESLMTLNASPATIFRTLANKQVTVLFDEVDAIWNKRGKDDTHEDLRALLNAGYKRGAAIPRCVGPKHDVTMFPVFAAVALAGLGDMPDTIMSRSIILRMRPRANEKLEPFRTRKHEAPGHELRERLALWGKSVGGSVGEAWPDLPPGITDRPSEVWEPLIAIADAAGGHWPTTAREACLALCKAASERRASLGIRLLSDLRTIFQKAGNPEALHTETLVERLTNGEEFGLEADAPWGDLYGKPLAKRGLASMLIKYNVRPIKVTVGGRSLQGYRREHLWKEWVRYLPPLSLTPALSELPEFLESSMAKQALADFRSIPGIPGESEAIPDGVSTALRNGIANHGIATVIPAIPDVRIPERAAINGSAGMCSDCAAGRPGQCTRRAGPAWESCWVTAQSGTETRECAK